MIETKVFFETLKEKGVSFFTGIPDSLLSDFCAYVTENAGEKEHIIAANEGGAIALATGYHLATGEIPLVYMQNSGIGNAINPLLSLADKEVYSIPMILLIGWRGLPGKKDEPQHVKQGRVQNSLLEAMEIPYFVLDPETQDIKSFLDKVYRTAEKNQMPTAIVVEAGTFSKYKITEQNNPKPEMLREEAMVTVLNKLSSEVVIVSTTGKTSRELFEYRKRLSQSHQNDFLTVGSMGHCSQIALSISMHSSKKTVCFDGDGALIMHMGSMGIIGSQNQTKFYHLVFNNGAHESVGGQPTVGFNINFTNIALSCGYKHAFSFSEKNELTNELDNILELDGPVFIEILVKKGSRSDLGRPTNTPLENKDLFTKFIRS